MKAECPNGHTLNLSFSELEHRLLRDDFDCVECEKEYSYEIDSRFWKLHMKTEDMSKHMAGIDI